MIGFICGRRTKWLVLVVWVVILALASGVASKLMSVEKNDAISFLPPAAQSTKVQDLAARFPSGKAQLATVVYHRQGGLTAADRATIEADRAEIDAHPSGAAGQQPAMATVTSTDGTTAYFSVPLSSTAEIDPVTDAVDHIRSVVGEGSGGLDVKVTGQAASLVDQVSAFKGLDGTLLIAAGLLVAVLLLIIYRSPFLWLLPLLAVGFAYQAAEAVIYVLARHGLTVNGQSGGILTVLIFGVGTDYALLIVARYREELVHYEDRHEAMAAALGRVAPTILASGGTVTLSLLCLLTASLNSDKGLGPVCAIGVVVVVCAMLTALPMLLLIVGRGVFWPFVPRWEPGTDPRDEVTQKRLWVRLGGVITAHARPIWIGCAVLLAVLSLGLLHLDTNLTNAQGFTKTVGSVAGQDLIDQSFPSGTTAPLIIITPATSATTAYQVAKDTHGIASVFPPQDSGDLAQVVAIGTAADSTPAADATITALRGQLAERVGPGALVGGPSAVDLDVRAATVHDQKVIIPLVLFVVLLVLMVLLRALLGPFLLVLSVLLSYLASLGVAAVVNTSVFGFAATSPSLPLFGFIFLVALGCDYNIFLMARVREETIGHGTREGTRRGLSATGGVITSAGIILAGTFAVLGVLPLVTLAEIGFIVAFGVLLDTFVVRSVLVPALVMDVGPAWWWPSALWTKERGKIDAAGPAEPGSPPRDRVTTGG